MEEIKWEINSVVKELPDDLNSFSIVEIEKRDGRKLKGSARTFVWKFLPHYIDADIVKYRIIYE